jgi:putative redox protein
MYANRKNYSIDEIRVYVSSEVIDKTYTLTRIIEMDGEIDDSVRTRMVQIANACPIHKTLTNPIEIKTELR